MRPNDALPYAREDGKRRSFERRTLPLSAAYTAYYETVCKEVLEEAISLLPFFTHLAEQIGATGCGEKGGNKYGDFLFLAVFGSFSVGSCT